MNDKQWLNKILTAYNVYPQKDKTIEDFIDWLFKQYGIVKSQPKK